MLDNIETRAAAVAARDFFLAYGASLAVIVKAGGKFAVLWRA